MAAGATVTVVERKNVISQKIRGVKTAVASSAWKTAQMMLREMHNRVPKEAHPRGGERTLDDSLTIVGAEGDDTLQVGSVGAHRGRPVAGFVERGTHHNRAQPFVRPAAARGRKQLKEDAEAAVRREANAD